MQKEQRTVQRPTFTSPMFTASLLADVYADLHFLGEGMDVHRLLCLSPYPKPLQASLNESVFIITVI